MSTEPAAAPAPGPASAADGGGDAAGVVPARIAYVLGSSAGGTGRHVAMLAAGLAARGAAVRVFGPAATGQRFFPPGGPVGFAPVEIAAAPRPARDLGTVRRLRLLLRDWAPEAVHAHGLRAGALTGLALGANGGRGRQVLVVTVHNAAPQGLAAGLAYAVLERVAARRADAVTWVSGDLARRMRRAGARDAGRALVPAPSFAPPTREQIAAARAGLGAGQRPVVLAVGRLAAQKGYPVLLTAAASWQDRAQVPLLVIAGEGPLAGRLSGQAAAGGLAVRFLGQRGDVPALLGGADVVVVPSLWEGQPLIVQETLRLARPLVATRAGGIPELTGPDAALLVPPGDPAALAAAVLSVLDDPGRAAALSAAATQRARDLPSADDAVAAAAALYQRLLRLQAG